MALDLPSIILQAGQMITESLRSAQQLQLQRQQMKEREGVAEETMKLRETKLKLETELAGIKLEKEKALMATAVSNAEVAVSTTGERIEQEKTQTSTAVLGLEKLNQDVKFNLEMEPYRRTIIQSNAQLKGLEAEAASVAGGAPDALSKSLDIINQRGIIQGRIISVAEDAAKLHVKRAGTREQILGNLGPQFKAKYGSREYGWFYSQREALTRALQTDEGQRGAALAAAGIMQTGNSQAERQRAAEAAGTQINELNQVIGSYENEVSKFINSSVDLSQIPINLQEMSRDVAMKSGTGAQTAGTFTQGEQVKNADGTTSPSPAQTAPEVQLERIQTGDIETSTEETLRAAGDLARTKGITFPAALSQIVNSITDPKKRAEIDASIRARAKKK